ncbi:MAG: beta-galactosidase, partial [Bacteroidales bacterium]|nr:beta-galactosidase [Bacteroidales bacterium]
MSLLRVSLLLFLYIASCTLVSGRESRKYNFNSNWLYQIGDGLDYKDTLFRDANWQKITLPRAFNEDEAFSVSIEKLTDTICWYRKHFRLPKGCNNKKIFVEFEGVRQGADFYLNGQHLGLHENGVMAVGLDLTSYIDYNKENILAVRIDNNWDYRERSSNSKYQWNNKNFNANYGGIPKNVWLHITDKMYQTLPLYSNLKTTGVYIYADQFDINHGKAR